MYKFFKLPSSWMTLTCVKWTKQTKPTHTQKKLATTVSITNTQPWHLGIELVLKTTLSGCGYVLMKLYEHMMLAWIYHLNSLTSLL